MNIIQRIKAHFRDRYWKKKLIATLPLFETEPDRPYQIALKILSKTTANSMLRADCYDFISDYWRGQGDIKKAIDYNQKAISIYRLWPKKTMDLASMLMQLAFLYDNSHQYNLALATYDDAITLAKQSNLHTLKVAILILKSDVYMEMRCTDEARNLLELAIEISEQNYLYENLTTAYSKLGDMSHELQQMSEAESYYQNALEWIEYDNEKIKAEVNTYVSLIDLYRHFEDKKKLHKTVQNVLKVPELANHIDMQYILYHYYLDQKDYPQATKLLYKIEAVYLKTQQFVKLSLFYPTSLRLFQETNNLSEGRLFFNKSIKLIQGKKLWSIEWLLYDMYGMLLEKTTHIKEALIAYRKATDALENYRKTIPEQYDRITFFEDKVHYLTHYCFVALRVHKNTDAFSFLESSKSKTLIDLLNRESPVQQLNARQIQILLQPKNNG